MIFLKLKNYSTALFLLLAHILLAACTTEKLIPLEKPYSVSVVSPYISAEADFCASPAVVTKQKVKYVFILDKSDSNQPGIPLATGDVSNTDPNGNRRYGPLIQFLRNLPADPNTINSFSLISFNDSAFVPISPNAVAGFDSDRNRFESVVKAEWLANDDRGFTNYISALQLAWDIIHQDALKEAGTVARPIITSSYRIIFVSDGIPRVNAGAGVYTQDFNTDLLPQINDILSLKNDAVLAPYITDIILNAAYYFPATQNAQAAGLLEKMADAGNGQFLKFGAGENVIYGAFSPPVSNVRQLLADVFVESESAVWWDDGTLHLDSDGDGLPDSVETKSGSSSSKRDSDGNGVSDYVEYRLKGQPCQVSTCLPLERNPFSVCDGLFPEVDGTGGFTFPDTDRDGLNNCEEFILKSDMNRFDSNGDFIPDFIAFKAGIPFITGTNGSFLQPQGDGLTNYEKIKAGLPINVASHKLQNFISRKTSIKKLDKSEGDRDCYHLSVDPVSVLGPDQFVRIYIVENASSISDNSKIRIAERRVDSGTDSLVFTEGEFK